MNNLKIAGYVNGIQNQKLNIDTVSNKTKRILNFTNKKFNNGKLVIHQDIHNNYCEKQRIGYNTLKNQLLNGEYDVIIFNEFTQISRYTKNFIFQIQEILEMGVRVISISEGFDSKHMTDEDIRLYLHLLFPIVSKKINK